VGEYLDRLLTSLARLEARTDNRGVIEANIARVNLGAMLGEALVEKYVLPSFHPDPWMLNGNDEWFKAHPVDGTDIRRGLHFYRVVRFSDALFTVGLGRISGFDVLRKRLRERTDMRALFAELEIASLLVKNKATVNVIGESGTRGQDFDLLVTVRGVPGQCRNYGHCDRCWHVSPFNSQSAAAKANTGAREPPGDFVSCCAGCLDDKLHRCLPFV
jgi:hypothetical protein